MYFGYISIFFFSSLAIISSTGYKLFTLSSNNNVDEIFASKEEDTKIAERLFSSSLVVVVTTSETNKLKVSISISNANFSI